MAAGAVLAGFFAALRMTDRGVVRIALIGAVRAVAFALAMLTVAVAGRAETPEGYRISPRDIRESVRAAVDGQLAAFETESLDAAYSFAARGIRRQFSADVFAEMIRRGYPALLRHARRDLGIVRDNRAGRAMVDVTVFDARGTPARFRYQLAEEREGWRVEGVLPIRAATRGEV